MKENNNQKPVIRVTEGSPEDRSDMVQQSGGNRSEKVKKSLIYALMGVVFFGCMYLIFKPSSSTSDSENIGLNDAVPQATGSGLQSDKQKAYEQEMMEQKAAEKRQAVMSLTDEWNRKLDELDASSRFDDTQNEHAAYAEKQNPNRAITSYRNAQQALGSFYEPEDHEAKKLRKEVEELKQELAQKEDVPANGIETQLALMEKSYEMAAKYLPQNNQPVETVKTETSASSQKEYFVAFTPLRKNTVSALYREQPDSALLSGFSEARNFNFISTGVVAQASQLRNSIRAVVQQTQLITAETGVRIRLVEDAKSGYRTIPKGTVLTANSAFQGGRLHLKISSVELNGNIIPVDMMVYDVDGQPGLYVPHSMEANALSEIASNMSQTSGTSIMMTRSAGQQVAGDLSRGLVQGVSGYFNKKIRSPKVTLKAGHQVYLVSKK